MSARSSIRYGVIVVEIKPWMKVRSDQMGSGDGCYHTDWQGWAWIFSLNESRLSETLNLGRGAFNQWMISIRYFKNSLFWASSRLLKCPKRRLMRMFNTDFHNISSSQQKQQIFYTTLNLLKPYIKYGLLHIVYPVKASQMLWAHTIDPIPTHCLSLSLSICPPPLSPSSCSLESIVQIETCLG